MISQKKGGMVLVAIAIILFLVFGSIKTTFEQQGVFLCEAVNANPHLDMAECPAHTSSVPTLVTLGFMVAVLLFVAGLYFVTVNKKGIKQKRSFKHINISSLSDNEKKIINILKEQDGSVYQSEIVKQTGLTKVKVTRLLDKLEHNDQIIERKRRGMTNIVVLK